MKGPGSVGAKGRASRSIRLMSSIRWKSGSYTLRQLHLGRLADNDRKSKYKHVTLVC